MSAMPIDMLELQAAEQRKRLHNSVSELRMQAREKLHPKKLARRYVWPLSAATALLSVISGYVFAGMFTRS
jgi:hypothetical protein